ncbi:hypothetical protein SLW70_08790 [Flavobacterium sp. NG2]|uniref:hypothetical protein n=1 Tax=Flavobacterium sp. NG2 TaxID=3097547 RepID=UPI002A82DF59|nr:hypothetical protein [Flavobacterium sp. NG2]WPR70046.1 hypothetical protein SLW70_08790 [Flavobacterium sp. NG2]
MKKIILTIAGVFAFGFVNAQSGSFKVGAHVGLPTGDIKDWYSLNLGADVAYVWSVSDKFQAGVTTGYTTYIGKTFDLPGGGSFKPENASFIPIAATAQFGIATDWFLGADLGYAIGVNDGNDGGFLYQPKIGYHGDTFEVYFGYKGIANDGSTASSVNVGVNFKL